MRVAVLVTGGKDSALALYRTMKQGFEIVNLVTMVPQQADSWMFHYPNIHMADLFAEAIGISLVSAETSGVKEEELSDLKQTLKRLRVDAVVSGAVSSQYQKKRIDRICKTLRIKHIAPLWQEEPLKLLNEILQLEMEVIIVGVFAYGFTEEWLGRKLDESAVSDLVKLNEKLQVSLVGEGGEYETLVLDAPFFRKRIRLVETERIWQGQSGCFLVKEAMLVDKKKLE